MVATFQPQTRAGSVHERSGAAAKMGLGGGRWGKGAGGAGHLTQGAVNSAAKISAALGARGGEAFLGLHQRRTCFSLRTMLLDLREKGGAPRWAAESPCHKIRGSARLAGVGLLIALLSALGCCSQAPGRAAKL